MMHQLCNEQTKQSCFFVTFLMKQYKNGRKDFETNITY